MSFFAMSWAPQQWVTTQKNSLLTFNNPTLTPTIFATMSLTTYGYL